MLTELIAQLIFIAMILGLLLLLLMASEANNRTMTRVWGSAIFMATLIGIGLTL